MLRRSSENATPASAVARILGAGSVERKLRLMVMAVTAMALLTVAIGVVLIDIVTIRRQLIDSLTAQADLVAENSPAVIRFEIPADATNVLLTLRTSPRVIAGEIFTADGRPYAGYHRQGRHDLLPGQVPLLGVALRADGPEVTRPVIHLGTTVGYVWLKSDFEDLHTRFRRYALVALVVLPTAFAAAAWLGSRLQRSVTDPILRLCASMRAVSERKDYTIRAERGSDDEVGQLLDGFNRMLQRIGEQDTALKAERAQLSQRVDERTAELRRANEELTRTNQRLQSAMGQAEQLAQAAEAASQSKSDFLAAVSHELRTPMNGVIGFTNLLLDTQLAGEQREFAEIIRNSGQTLLTLINDILDFSKIEAGKFALERLPFDPRDAIEEVAELLGQRADEKGLEIALNLDPTLPPRLMGDPARFRQVLLNLVGNAIKFTHAGHVLIEAGPASAVARRHPGIPESAVGGILVCVNDTGIGIPREKQALVFERFTQADSSTTRKYGGTGLGLAISKRLTELMGGSIGVISEVGRGSVFWFSLPELPVPDEEPGEPRTDAPPGGEAPDPVVRLRGIRVLVVDDLEVNRRVLHEQLRSWDVEHDLVDGGPAALHRLVDAQRAGRPFHVALLDFLMPGMDGLELGRRIRGHPEIGETRLVMITSGSQRTEVGQFMSAGFGACLLKPLVRPRLLAETIADVIQAGHGEGGVRAEATGTAAPAVPAALPVESGAGSVPKASQAEPAPSQAGTGSPSGPEGGAGATSAAAGVTSNAILLAEDNRTNQIYARRLLEKMGWTVDVAENGVQAVERALTKPYRLILMDCQMPEMNGYDAAGNIRQKVEGPRIPIVALTAHALVGERERCLAAGMDDYLAKPFQRGDLEKVLDRWAPGGPGAQL